MAREGKERKETSHPEWHDEAGRGKRPRHLEWDGEAGRRRREEWREGLRLITHYPYDVELYQRIEHLIGKKLPLYVTQEAEVMILQERVAEAQRIAKTEMKDGSEKKQGHGKRKGGVLDDDDMEEAPGVRKRLKGKKKKHRH
uniref:Uncharacterized protein n=1 Tax=Timema genevievae TaxID=629358 RepID=A0A7R9PIU9_TIMGE|nr:unnamed protein product [Timema genevievae]